MNCRQVLELLSAYVDGELMDDVRSAVDEHLSGCRCSCGCMCSTLRRTVILYRQQQPEPLSREVYIRLEYVLREEWRSEE